MKIDAILIRDGEESTKRLMADEDGHLLYVDMQTLTAWLRDQHIRVGDVLKLERESRS